MWTFLRSGESFSSLKMYKKTTVRLIDWMTVAEKLMCSLDEEFSKKYTSCLRIISKFGIVDLFFSDPDFECGRSILDHWRHN